LADAGGLDDGGDAPPNAAAPCSIATCEIDPSLVDSIRTRMPVRRHRREAEYNDRGGGGGSRPGI